MDWERVWTEYNDCQASITNSPLKVIKVKEASPPTQVLAKRRRKIQENEVRDRQES